MKKIFAVMLLVVSLIFGNQQSASAHYGYAGSDGVFDYYVLSFIHYDCSAIVGIYPKNSNVPYSSVHIRFTEERNGNVSYVASDTGRNPAPRINRQIAMAVYQIVKREIAELINQRRAEEAEQQRRAEEERQRKLEKEAKKQRIAKEKERKFDDLIAEGDKFYTAKNYESARSSYANARKNDSSKVDRLCSELIKTGDKLYKEKKQYTSRNSL